MNNVNKTLYIPLYGKSYVSKSGLFLSDKKAEEIWAAEGFELGRKAKSKWLAYYMGIRSAVFDEWTREELKRNSEAIVIHVGCGMDSRVLRVGGSKKTWYDVDFAEVINERKRYYEERESYKMLVGDAREHSWLNELQGDSAIVILEGISMYLKPEELKSLMEALDARFSNISVLIDCYSVFGAKMSKHKNPINEVGVREAYGIDEPRKLNSGALEFLCEHNMTPPKYIDELSGAEKIIFKTLYGGYVARSIYRLFEYKK